MMPHDRSKPTSFVLQFSIGPSKYKYKITQTLAASKDPVHSESLEKDDQLLFRRDGEVLRSPIAPIPNELLVPTPVSSLFVLIRVVPPHDRMHKELRPVAEYLRSVRYYPLSQQYQEHSDPVPTPFIESAKFEKWKAALAAGRPTGSVTNRLVHMHLFNPDKLDELRKLLGEDGLGLLAEIRIEEVKLRKGKVEDSAEPTYSILFVPCSGIAGAGRAFRYSGLSLGTWRVLRLLTYLVFDGSSCMLVEQPEDSIHAGLLGKVIDILRTYSEQTQLICTTHSPRVINLVDAKGIRVVTVENGRTEVSELSPGEISEAQSYLSDEGTLAEFLETL